MRGQDGELHSRLRTGAITEIGRNRDHDTASTTVAIMGLGFAALPAGLLLGFPIWAMNATNPTDGGEVTALAVAGGAWVAMTLTMLVTPRGRRWLINRRAEWCLGVIVTLACLVVADVMMTVTSTIPTIAEQRRHSLSYTYGLFTRYRLIPGEGGRIGASIPSASTRYSPHRRSNATSGGGSRSLSMRKVPDWAAPQWLGPRVEGWRSTPRT